MANAIPSATHRLCRLCFTDQHELYPIFGDEMPDLAVKIFDCTTVEINNLDGIPALICQQCRAKIVICSHNFGTWKSAVRKHRKRFEESKSATQDVKKIPPNVPNKVEVNGAIPAKPSYLDRLANDDKARCHSIDEDRNVDIKFVAKKRLSEDAQVANTSMELLAVKIEQSIKNKIDQKVQLDGSRECSKCGLEVHNIREHKHKQIEATVGKHVCGICNKTFSKRFLLKYHVNVHTGEKPYSCKECNQRFASPTSLHRHKQIHSGAANFTRSEDQRFHCNVCNCVFKHRKLIYKHMRTKHYERKFPCETCGKAFFAKCYLQKHIKFVHRATAS